METELAAPSLGSTITEAAVELGVSEQTVRRWIKAGELRSLTCCGRSLFVPRSAIRAFRAGRGQQ